MKGISRNMWIVIIVVILVIVAWALGLFSSLGIPGLIPGLM